MKKPMSLAEAKETYRTIMERAKPQELMPICRHLAKHDLFFLLYHVLGRKDLDHPWLYARCNEVQASPNGHLDLWFRDGYKSTIITYAKTIQDILLTPDVTLVIFSCTRPIAKAFLRQIKLEFESNPKLISLFPDILYSNPKKDSPKWSEDGGIVVKRKTNPKEATLEAWGLVDGQPTSKHFQGAIYDDVVTKEFVSTPEMVEKTNDAWMLSRNLSTATGWVRYIGTRYSYNDTYKVIMERKAAKPRIYPATDDGTPEGNPVLWDRGTLMRKMKEMGSYVAAAQLFQDPKMKSTSGFNVDDVRYWPAEHTKGLNIGILVDPANEKVKRSDYTVFMVVGRGGDDNYYIIDIIRDKLNLTEKCNTLFKLHRTYRPIFVGYEKYGMQSDQQHFEYKMGKENYRFTITPLGGNVGKNDRIMGLQSYFEAHRIYIPDRCVHTNYLGIQVDNSKVFVNDEMALHPFSSHDDMLDCLARIRDPDTRIPLPEPRRGFFTKRQKVADNDYDPLA